VLKSVSKIWQPGQLKSFTDFSHFSLQFFYTARQIFFMKKVCYCCSLFEQLKMGSQNLRAELIKFHWIWFPNVSKEAWAHYSPGTLTSGSAHTGCSLPGIWWKFQKNSMSISNDETVPWRTCLGIWLFRVPFDSGSIRRNSDRTMSTNLAWNLKNFYHDMGIRIQWFWFILRSFLRKWLVWC
jgi:hypothetical protein